MPVADARRLLIRLLLPAVALVASRGFAQVVISPPTVVKSFATPTVGLNSSITLTFTITNPNGATDLTGINLNDNLPAGLIIANPDSQTGTGVITPAVTNINLVGGTVLAGSSCTFSIDVLAIAAGTQINTTDPVTSNEGGTGGTATATVDVLLPDMTITKSHTGNFRQGQIGAVYAITVSVAGADSSGQVTVTDTLPAGLTATDISGANWVCSAPPTLSCSRVDSLPITTSYEPINVTVNVAANAPALLTNTATVSGGGETDTTNDTATDPTTVDIAADLAISSAHTGNFTPGQTGATYTLTVSNTTAGPTVGAVTVTDILPAVPNTLVATAISGTGWTCDLPTLTCTRADALASGSYPPITLTVNVPANIQPNVTNTATVSGGGEINTANDTASDPTHIGAPLQIAAQPMNVMIAAGGSGTVSLTVNSSNGLGAITFACSSLPIGATCSFNPPSVTQLTSTVTLTIATTARKSAALPLGMKETPAIYAMLLSLLGLAGLVMTRLGWMGKRKRFEIRLAFSLAALSGVVLLVTLSGCGGSSVNPNGTPAGTSSVTVTATSASTSTSATVPVSLTVQ